MAVPDAKRGERAYGPLMGIGTSRVMAFLRCMVMTLLLLAPVAGRAQAPENTGPIHLAMTLVAETPRPRAGSTVMLALESRPESGWHGYWRNPGDAGFAPSLDWTLPRGATISAPEWPVPTTLIVADLMNYVYEAPYAPLLSLRVPAGLAAGTRLPIRLHATYLVCTREICVPENQSVEVTLTIGNGAVLPETRARFDQHRRAIPRPLASEAVYQVKDGALDLAVPYPSRAPLDDAYFFPVTTGAIDYAVPQKVTRDGDRLVIATRGKRADAIDGVLRIASHRGLLVHAVPGIVAGGGEDAAWGAALLAFAGAVLGGLILNIMPCVFPILSLKALSLARGGAGEREARREALAYTAGVVLVCAGLGAIILGLRAGGAVAGWAFQLQDPRVVCVLLLLSVAIALNLSGLFEVPMPRFAGNSGTPGAFATGALAAFVATPCTGPFMGAALGAALVLPWYVALAIFAGLGLGLAIPFLLIGFIPALRKRLPRPGAWMERFRRILGVPMWLTALALAWVLGRQAGVDGMTIALGAALIVGFALWAGGRRQQRGLAFGLAPALILALTTAVTASIVSRAPAAHPASDSFSEARLASLRSQDKPVFAYFTADWCLTCKVNEHSSIDIAATRAAFSRHGIEVLVGDWTDGDPALGRFIQAHNRAGVPLYLFYPRGGGEPQVLPQVLTPAMLQSLGS